MMPFLRKLAEPCVRDVRRFLNKVVDYTEGTKTPVFNKRKAGQLIKLMEQRTLESSKGSDLKAEIRKVQD